MGDGDNSDIEVIDILSDIDDDHHDTENVASEGDENVSKASSNSKSPLLETSANICNHGKDYNSTGNVCLCGTTFTTRKALVTHLSNNEFDCKESFQCGICGKGFHWTGNRRKHMSEAHQVEIKGMRFGCVRCGSYYKSRGQLLRHCRTTHKCDPGNRVHKMNHGVERGKRGNACICRQRFRSSGFLRSHIRLNTPSLHLKCEECNKKFLWRNGLTEHLEKVHHIVWKPKPYPPKFSVNTPENEVRNRKTGKASKSHRAKLKIRARSPSPPEMREESSPPPPVIDLESEELDESSEEEESHDGVSPIKITTEEDDNCDNKLQSPRQEYPNGFRGGLILCAAARAIAPFYRKVID